MVTEFLHAQDDGGGAASLSDFLNSDYAYKEAQSNYITSLLNFLSGRLDYEKSQGTLNTYIKQL